MNLIKSALTLFVLVFGYSTYADGPLPKTPIAIKMEKAGARLVLETIFKKANVKYDLPATLTNDKKLSIDASGMPFEDVLKWALSELKYTYTVDASGVVRLVAK